MSYATPYDTTPFVSESIYEVLKTLGEAMVLVFIVVYLFCKAGAQPSFLRWRFLSL
jgi:HAE1 family hydrophobic/amphiphilic exporter-1/multidrug efflux pump